LLAILVTGGLLVSLVLAPHAVNAAENYEPFAFTHFAGTLGGAGYSDDTGSAARLNYPFGVATDSAGNLYVADTDNHTIRKITAAGVVTTWAGVAGIPGSADGTGSVAHFNYPSGVATDSTDNLYVADTSNHTIRKVTPAGMVTTLAGLAGSSGGVDGTGSAARFNSPYGVVTDSAGNIYVADTYNHCIRKITPAGVVTTFAGGGWGTADGTGSAAQFNHPQSVAIDSVGNIYVADTYNYTVRKVTPAGVATTLAGLAFSFGSADGTGSAARFAYPDGIVIDSAGNVVVGDSGNHTIRKITPAGVVTTMAGMAGTAGSADGTGNAARFYYPAAVTIDSTGNFYVADQWNCNIRKITPAGVVTTLAGLAGSWGTNDGTGSEARFDYPRGVATDSAGNVYVADADNYTIRKITPVGVVSTLAGLAGSAGSADGAGSAARFSNPTSVATDSSGNIYVADASNHTIRKITPAGVVATLAGLAASSGTNDGTGSAARFYYPIGVAADSTGNIYVADTENYTIRKITPAGVVTTLAGLAGSTGSADGTGSAARFNTPYGVATDSAGNVYVADSLNFAIRKITSAGVVTTLAGSAAQFYEPYGVATDSVGNVYVADTHNNTIRKITPAGVVTTLAGLARSSGTADGVGSAARFWIPHGVATDSAGNVYVADTYNHTIRKGIRVPQLAIASDGSGGYFISAQGAPGFTCSLLRAASLAGPWSTNTQQTADNSGLIQFHDLAPPPSQGFYRTLQP
jgi:D-alanyl-D-alanine dipeptidase